MKIAFALSLLALLMLYSSGCGNLDFESQLKDRDIIIDGDPADWGGVLELVEDANFSFGIMNDGRYLYIAIVTADRTVQRQIMLSGLRLWFDGSGNDEKRFGIRFPIGLQEDGCDLMELREERNGSKLKSAFNDANSELMIADDEGIWRRLNVGSLEDIDVAAGFKNNAMVLEFKVILAHSGQFGFGIGAAAGTVIGVGVESPEVEFEQLKKQMRTAKGGPRGGMGGSGGGTPGGGRMGGHRGGMRGMGKGGSMGGQRPERPEPIDIWATVTLSKGNM